MKLLLALILFSFHFSQADQSLGIVDSPMGCFSKKAYPCSLRVTEAYLAFERGENQFHLAENSALLFWSPSQVQLLQGKVWIRDSKELAVKISSSLQIHVTGEWFFEKQPDATMLARNLSGGARFESRFVFQSEALPVGFQNWFGQIDSSGQISRGVIRPIAQAPFLKSWLPVSGLPIALAKKRAANYKALWSEAVEQSASLYQQVIERRLASHEEKARRLAAQKASREAERAQLKKMYREKNGL